MAIVWKEIYRAGGTDVAIADGGTGQSTAQTAINALTAVSGATNEHVLTKDTATGNAIFKAAGAAAAGGLFEINIGGDLEPVTDVGAIDEYYELDVNDDVMPKAA